MKNKLIKVAEKVMYERGGKRPPSVWEVDFFHAIAAMIEAAFTFRPKQEQPSVNVQKLLEILEVIVEHDPKMPLNTDPGQPDRLWIAPVGELPDALEEKLTKLGARLDHGRGWFVWL